MQWNITLRVFCLALNTELYTDNFGKIPISQTLHDKTLILHLEGPRAQHYNIVSIFLRATKKIEPSSMPNPRICMYAASPKQY